METDNFQHYVSALAHTLLHQGMKFRSTQEITAEIAQEVTLTSFFLMHDLLFMPSHQIIYLLDKHCAAVVGFFDLNVGECL